MRTIEEWTKELREKIIVSLPAHVVEVIGGRDIFRNLLSRKHSLACEIFEAAASLTWHEMETLQIDWKTSLLDELSKREQEISEEKNAKWAYERIGAIVNKTVK